MTGKGNGIYYSRFSPIMENNIEELKGKRGNSRTRGPHIGFRVDDLATIRSLSRVRVYRPKRILHRNKYNSNVIPTYLPACWGYSVVFKVY